jgi:hypothetical protein
MTFPILKANTIFELGLNSPLKYLFSNRSPYVKTLKEYRFKLSVALYSSFTPKILPVL